MHVIFLHDELKNDLSVVTEAQIKLYFRESFLILHLP